jgi:hypothetical protein
MYLKSTCVSRSIGSDVVFSHTPQNEQGLCLQRGFAMRSDRSVFLQAPRSEGVIMHRIHVFDLSGPLWGRKFPALRHASVHAPLSQKMPVNVGETWGRNVSGVSKKTVRERVYPLDSVDRSVRRRRRSQHVEHDERRSVQCDGPVLCRRVQHSIQRVQSSAHVVRLVGPPGRSCELVTVTNCRT